MEVVDRPTQLIYIGISICQHTSKKDIAGQSANVEGPQSKDGDHKSPQKGETDLFFLRLPKPGKVWFRILCTLQYYNSASCLGQLIHN